MGLNGDQDLDYKKNKTLCHSNENGIEVHLFEVLHPKIYTYYGTVKLTALPYTAKQPDQMGNPRTVCMFPLCKC